MKRKRKIITINIVTLIVLLTIATLFFSPIIISILLKNPIWLFLFLVSWIPSGALLIIASLVAKK